MRKKKGSKMKTVQEKIDEKKKTLKEINETLDKSLILYDIMTKEFGNLYSINKGKVDGKQTLSGIAQMLSKINEMLVTRNSIENEINGLLELDEQENAKPVDGSVTGSKEAILKLREGSKKIS